MQKVLVNETRFIIGAKSFNNWFCMKLNLKCLTDIQAVQVPDKTENMV